MRISLFSQSLSALPLEAAIAGTVEAGYGAIELACMPPHLDLGLACSEPQRVADRIAGAGLRVAALSLVNSFTDSGRLDEQVEAAETFMRLAPLFGTALLKLTPGAPASGEATDEHWRTLARAVERLAPTARELGLRLAFETHMRQLTDTLASTRRFLDMVPADVVGLTVDFSNLAFAGEDVPAATAALAPQIFHTHVKNGWIDADGGWHFQPLDQGLTDYVQVLSALRDIGFGGYLSIECLGPDARERPVETARRDREILMNHLRALA